jgi:translation initiation factor 3 subunit G
LERVKSSSSSKPDGPAGAAGGDLASLGNASLIVCRTCGKKGDHWTSKCPFKDLMGVKGFGDKPPEDDMPLSSSAGAAAPAARNSYVPPSMRAGAVKGDADGMRRGRDENSIRVTNLSEDTREQDLQELFRPFGSISRIYVAFDRETGLSRGFAFINFVNRYVVVVVVVVRSMFSLALSCAMILDATAMGAAILDQDVTSMSAAILLRSGCSKHQCGNLRSSFLCSFGL